VNREQSDGVVKRIHVLWNQTPKDIDLVCEAWWRFLHDLDANDVHGAVDDLMVTEPRFMPKVGEVRRMALAPDDSVPSPIEAWQQFQSRLKAVNSGNSLPDVHELVMVTMRRLGGGAGMHTNGDREMFMDLYKSVVAGFEAERYRVKR
jgi:hypothetical protein